MARKRTAMENDLVLALNDEQRKADLYRESFRVLASEMPQARQTATRGESALTFALYSVMRSHAGIVIVTTKHEGDPPTAEPVYLDELVMRARECYAHDPALHAEWCAAVELLRIQRNAIFYIADKAAKAKMAKEDI